MYPCVPFKDLGIVLCNAKNKRKIKRTVFDKLTYDAIPLYYNKWGQIFRKDYGLCSPRNKNKKYYSMEEVQEIYINYIEGKGSHNE